MMAKAQPDLRPSTNPILPLPRLLIDIIRVCWIIRLSSIWKLVIFHLLIALRITVVLCAGIKIYLLVHLLLIVCATIIHVIFVRVLHNLRILSFLSLLRFCILFRRYLVQVFLVLLTVAVEKSVVQI